MVEKFTVISVVVELVEKGQHVWQADSCLPNEGVKIAVDKMANFTVQNVNKYMRYI